MRKRLDCRQVGSSVVEALGIHGRKGRIVARVVGSSGELLVVP